MHSMKTLIVGSYAPQPLDRIMDLVEELLELSEHLTMRKIKQVCDRIAGRIPHLMLP